MKWSIKVGKMFGIDVHLHFTFLLLLAFLGIAWWQNSGGLDGALIGPAFLAALFGCVLLHEFGHALMARMYGIRTSDITLLPVGGIARLERIPEKPEHELWIALSGPAVNLAIAALLFVALATTRGLTLAADFSLVGGSAIQRLMAFNLALAAINLLPALPLDGGRMLRALLTRHLSRRRATALTANVGQAIAILLGLIGFFSTHPWLVFLAIVVFLGAQAEAGIGEMRSAFKGLRVRDAMMTGFRRLALGDSVGRAVDELLAGSQQDFPVVENERAVGIVRRNDLIKALREGRSDTTVAEIMCRCRDLQSVDEADSLSLAVAAMQARRCASVPVVQGARIVGLLSTESISEMILAHAALDRAGTTGRDGLRSSSPQPAGIYQNFESNELG